MVRFCGSSACCFVNSGLILFVGGSLGFGGRISKGMRRSDGLYLIDFVVAIFSKGTREGE